MDNNYPTKRLISKDNILGDAGSYSEEEHPTVRRLANPILLVVVAKGNLADVLQIPPGSTRKRIRQSGEWKKVKKSPPYNAGLARTQSGEKPRVGPGYYCKQRQYSIVSEKDRKLVHDAYWKLGKAILRQNCIVDHCIQTAKAKSESTRGDPIKYYFTEENGTQGQVCEFFFVDFGDFKVFNPLRPENLQTTRGKSPSDNFLQKRYKAKL
ncbi:unnamed protein product [Lepeophtheirus salmonis]|uniref:(salmon louse) hypothetical protein n=1 Tax=Lepeophtheirus salmonis TaxID=72036 RepID=A0A7R8H7L0_LEPSM|nr:unnamed protein product [Lepeophtheirus salmonis]CAF2925036.1 unnamed protein product [Lepeophtheirus salmonis]